MCGLWFIECYESGIRRNLNIISTLPTPSPSSSMIGLQPLIISNPPSWWKVMGQDQSWWSLTFHSMPLFFNRSKDFANSGLIGNLLYLTALLFNFVSKEFSTAAFFRSFPLCLFPIMLITDLTPW